MNKYTLHPGYPMFAWIVAMVGLTADVKLAMLSGIGLIFAEVLLLVLREMMPSKKPVAAGLAAAVATLVMGLIFSFTGIEGHFTRLSLFAVASVAVCVHYAKEKINEVDYDQVLFVDAIAYALLFLNAIAMETLTKASIFTQVLTTKATAMPMMVKNLLLLVIAVMMSLALKELAEEHE